MDNSEIIELKKSTAIQLREVEVEKYNLSDTDGRISIYIDECIYNPDRHNLYELLAIKRFFYLLDKYDYRPGEVRGFITLFEMLKFSGDQGATRIKATPVQVFQFASIKGFYYKGHDKRLINDALLFVPRKFGKTTEVSAFMVDDLLFGDANSQSFAGANSYQQAQILFTELKNVLRRLGGLKRFKINREQITTLGSERTSFARCLASDASRLDGLNASSASMTSWRRPHRSN